MKVMIRFQEVQKGSESSSESQLKFPEICINNEQTYMNLSTLGGGVDFHFFW